MDKIYRYRSQEGAGIWVGSKALAEKWLFEEYIENQDFDCLELGDTCYIESLDLYDISSDLNLDDQAKIEKTWEVVLDTEKTSGDPKEDGYDFDYYAIWKETEVSS